MSQMTTIELAELLEEILVDAYSEDEQLWALHQAFEDNVDFPSDAFVIGQPVVVVDVEYDGNKLRGLTAKCQRGDGNEYAVAMADLTFPQSTSAGRYLAAYRKWMNLEPLPRLPGPKKPARRHKATDEDIDLSGPVELVALRVKESAIRCRLLNTERTITLKTNDGWMVVPGQLVTVRPRKQWRYGGHPYLSGEILDLCVDASSLALEPLGLEQVGTWAPSEQYWDEEGESQDTWVASMIAAGPRPEFAMERVSYVSRSDSVNDDQELSDVENTLDILAEMLEVDLRSLSAHAQLGAISFETSPRLAIHHYEVGFRIGELSLGEQFTGVLPWGRIDNRPFLQCMHGYALCLWRLDRSETAAELFERLLWLNPTDNQGCRFSLAAIQAGEQWNSSRKRV